MSPPRRGSRPVRSAWLCLLLVPLVAALALGCGDDDSSRANGDGQALATATADGADGPGPTDGLIPTPDIGPGPATNLGELRDELAARLEAIGVNIGSVPDDVLDDLLATCRQLEEFIDQDAADEICDAIEQAAETGDFGLIDLVIEKLAELEES